MRSFCARLTSRKFLATMSVIVACAGVVFKPERVETVRTVCIQVVSLIVMLLAAIGYAVVEARVDKSKDSSD